jgi:hypothetical protein
MAGKSLSSNERTPHKSHYSGNKNIFCLCGNDKHIGKFTDMFSNVGKGKPLPESIQDVLGLEFEDIEEQPTKVCRSCQIKLEGFSKFKSSALTVRKSILGQVTLKRCLVFSLSESGPNPKATCTATSDMHPHVGSETNADSVTKKVCSF